MSTVIETKKALINSNQILIKCVSNYLVPYNFSRSANDTQLIFSYYRRLMRLRRYVSKRQMIQNTYVGYVKYKFKYEDYEKRRKLVLPESKQLNVDWPQRLHNTYHFILHAASYVEPGDSTLEQDILMSRQILKNILTNEYSKIEKDDKPGSTDFLDYRIAFKQHDPEETSKNVKSLAIGEFDKNVIYLNETLGTQL